MVRANVPEMPTMISNRRGGGGFGAAAAHRQRAGAARAARRARAQRAIRSPPTCGVCSSGIPGVVITTRASGGNNQITRLLSGGNQDSRLAVEIRGEDLTEARRIAQDVLTALQRHARRRQSAARA